MNRNYVFVVLLASAFCFGQVGVNTTEPKSTLDVNGNLIVRTVKATEVTPSYDFLVQNSETKEVEKINGSLTVSALGKTIAKGVEKDGVSLLSGSLFAGWQKIDFGSGHVPINQGANFSAATDFYTVPSDGIYEINYQFRYGSGVMASLLNFSGVPSIGILKHTASGYTVLDSRKFSGVSVPLLVSIIVSDTSINSVYQLNAGDRLSFELNAGGLSLGLLGSSHAEFVIKKISD